MGSESETYKSNLLVHLNILEKFIDRSVLKYGELQMQESVVKAIKVTETRLNEATLHEHEIEQKNNSSDTAFNKSVDERYMQTQESKVDRGKALDANLVVTESSGTESEKHDTSSRSGNDTHADDVDSKPINNKEPMAEVHLTAKYNVLANEKQHAEQTEFNNEEKVDQDAEQCQVKSPLLDPSPDNKITGFSNQSLESENISLKKIVAQFQKYFSRMEAHCVNLELKYQNQALKFGQHDHILNETSNKAKIKKEIEALETINIELEHSVAKLLKENVKLHEENKHLKQTYKDLYNSIKKTRIQKKNIMTH
ncbi:hypothetical protein Tco_0148938 [Tanacetum coccineum]